MAIVVRLAALVPQERLDHLATMVMLAHLAHQEKLDQPGQSDLKETEVIMVPKV